MNYKVREDFLFEREYKLIGKFSLILQHEKAMTHL